MTLAAINNNRGGTGKTTSAVNLAVALVMKGNKALLVDLGILLTKINHRHKAFNP